jgi:hypothetical protein
MTFMQFAPYVAIGYRQQLTLCQGGLLMAWQHNPMITAGTGPLIWIDLGRDEPGMTLQRIEDREWVDVVEDGKVVKSPVKIDKLPPGKYRLVN